MQGGVYVGSQGDPTWISFSSSILSFNFLYLLSGVIRGWENKIIFFQTVLEIAK
jgi:hypothetical protein